MAHRLALPARADLDDIWEYLILEGSGEAVADRMIDTLTDRFYLLADWPRLGRARNDLRRGLRSYPVGDYIIFYRIERRDVVIQRVLHGRRNVERIIRRR